MRPFGAVALVAMLVIAVGTGCSQAGREVQGTGAGEGTLSSQDRQEKTSAGGEATRATVPDDETAGREIIEAPFTAAPEMGGGSEGVADVIREVTFERGEGYERAVVYFGLAGAPASGVPVWTLDSPEGEGYARITFPDVGATLDPDGGLGGSIMDNFYVVRDPDEGVFVDIYAKGAFQYRVTELSEPGRLVVDYRPADAELGFPLPTQAQTMVLFEPRVDEAVTSPLRVAGYSRNPEASNTVTFVDADGGVLARSTVLSNDWLETWGYFETTLEFPAFEGQAILRVGGADARDGSFEGVEVPVTYGGG